MPIGVEAYAMIARLFCHGTTMKLHRPICFCLLMFAAVSAASANDFEAALSKETAQFTFRSDSSLIGWGGSDLGLGLFYNEESDFIMQASLLQMRQASQENPLTFGVGVKGYLGQLDDPDEDVFLLCARDHQLRRYRGSDRLHHRLSDRSHAANRCLCWITASGNRRR
jgi:hypothetical protein